METPKPAVAPQAKSGSLNSKEKRELESLERTIQETENRQSEIAGRLATAGSDFELQQKLGTELQGLQQQLDKQMARWSELAEQA